MKNLHGAGSLLHLSKTGTPVEGAQARLGVAGKAEVTGSGSAEFRVDGAAPDPRKGLGAPGFRHN